MVKKTTEVAQPILPSDDAKKYPSVTRALNARESSILVIGDQELPIFPPFDKYTDMKLIVEHNSGEEKTTTIVLMEGGTAHDNKDLVHCTVTLKNNQPNFEFFDVPEEQQEPIKKWIESLVKKIQG